MLPPVGAFLRAWFAAPQRPVEAFGLTFPNPIGLAAGYDKDGLGWRGLACLGFGHIEIGTVTPRPQSGNPKPRLFRLVEERAVINRMGFPGRGAAFVARQISSFHSNVLRRHHPSSFVLGVNIGKNKDTPLEDAARDYVSLVQTFSPLADYLAINVSSPNTEGLRRLQTRDALQALLSALADSRHEQVECLGRWVPLLVKLAPDLTNAELDDALDAILATGMDGVIATNTTVGRDGVRSPLARETGGLSGTPLRQRSTAVVHQIYQRTQGKLPIVGVGGVAGTADVLEKFDAGAILVQVYTGLIYEGPGMVKRILKGLPGEAAPRP
jgi:dihydroorotate dehydrogenase